MVAKIRLAGMALAFCAVSWSVAAQDYPSKPITLIVPFATGGGTDAMSRIVAEHMSGTLGQRVVVENHVGAGGTIGSRRAARAAPDGYTIVMGGLGSHATSLGLYKEPGYDPRTDFTAVSLVAYLPLFVIAKKSLPVSDFRSFVALLKADPSKLSYGSAGVGSSAHLACLYLEHLVGVKVEHIPFTGAGPALTALLGEHVDYTCDAAGPAVAQVKSGAVKGLVVTGRNRMVALPDMPTSAEQGMPNFIVYGWNMIMVPKGTPAAIVDRLNTAVAAAINDKAVIDRIVNAGAEMPMPEERGPQAGDAFVRAEVDKWLPLMKAAGVQPQ